MHTQLLIDDLVRQTTVLIAQLSTAAGLRAPLSQIADQVFLELSRELEAQGVRRKVVADMFGLALRSYQLKLKRVSDNVETQEGTLWQELFTDLSRSSATRSELEERHRTHSPRHIGATLQDMVKSGLAYSSGQGMQAIYGLTSESDRRQLTEAKDQQVLANMVWYLAASGASNTRASLKTQLRADDGPLNAAIKALLEDGRLRQDGKWLRAQRFEVAVGSAQGWETAVCDHFRAVATSIAAKVSQAMASEADEIGGGTVSFRMHRSHPMANEVYALLHDTRTRANTLWAKVAAYNEANSSRDTDDRVTFYFGQNVVSNSQADVESGSNESSTAITNPPRADGSATRLTDGTNDENRSN